MKREEIILAFCREFTVQGVQIRMSMSLSQQREMSRVAICKARRQSHQFTDDMTYAAAFFVAFGESIERRIVDAKPLDIADRREDDFDDDDDTDAE